MQLYDENVERICLSCAIMGRQALLKLIEQVTIDDFYFDNHKQIFKTIIDLNNEKIQIDLPTIRDRIDPKIDLINIFNSSTVSTNIYYFIDRLLEYSKRRQMAALSPLINDYAKDQDLSIPSILQEIEIKLKAIDKEKGKELISINQLLDQDIKNFQLNENNYIKTGFKQLDEYIYGFLKSELIVLAGRTSKGKSALALNIAHNVAETKKVLFFSLEMPVDFLAIRLLSAESMIDSFRIMHNMIDQYELKKLDECAIILKKLNLQFIDQMGLTSNQIINISRRSAEYKKPDLIIVDYLQIMNSLSKESRYIRIGEDTRALKGLAREMSIPVLILSQLGRGVESREKQIPRLSDLRESGDIENDADKVIFIYQENQETNNVRLMIEKNKNGPSGYVDMTFEKRFTKFI